ncbi:MAG: phosphatase PAP2 family protein [Acidobacteriota bacterium]
MKNRSTSDGFFGWHLVIGLLVFVAMTIVLAQISDQVMEGEPLTVTDAQLSQWLHAKRTPGQVTAFRYVTSLGSTVVASTLATVVGIFLLWRGQRYWFTTLLISILGGVLLNVFLKTAFQRARPSFDDPIMTFTGYSFPSGHTLTATVLYGCLAALIVANTKHRGVRLLTILIACLLIALVGFSRIYLGAHYLTDVLAAIAEGLAWLSLSFTLVYSFWRQRNNQSRKQILN